MMTESVWFICIKKNHNLIVCKQPKLKSVLVVQVAWKSRVEAVLAVSSHGRIKKAALWGLFYKGVNLYPWHPLS